MRRRLAGDYDEVAWGRGDHGWDVYGKNRRIGRLLVLGTSVSVRGRHGVGASVRYGDGVDGVTIVCCTRDCHTLFEPLKRWGRAAAGRKGKCNTLPDL